MRNEEPRTLWKFGEGIKVALKGEDNQVRVVKVSIRYLIIPVVKLYPLKFLDKPDCQMLPPQPELVSEHHVLPKSEAAEARLPF